MKAVFTARSASARDQGLSETTGESEYSRFFEAGRSAAMSGNGNLAQELVPETEEQITAWNAGRASKNLNTLM